MKTVMGLMIVVLVVVSVNAQMIILEGVDGSTITTGDLLDEADHVGRTTNVVEISGLEITARSGGTTQDVNVTTDSMGIDSDGSGDDSDAFELSETLFVYFNKDLQINQFDFNHFESNETITVVIEGMPEITIAYDDLTNKTYDYFNTNITVDAGTEIGIYTTTSGEIGLDGIDVTVLSGPGEPSLALLSSNGISQVLVDFDGLATTNYVLQSCTNLTSNVWSTVSVPITADTNWVVETTNTIEFFRAVVD